MMLSICSLETSKIHCRQIRTTSVQYFYPDTPQLTINFTLTQPQARQTTKSEVISKTTVPGRIFVAPTHSIFKSHSALKNARSSTSALYLLHQAHSFLQQRSRVPDWGLCSAIETPRPCLRLCGLPRLIESPHPDEQAGFAEASCTNLDVFAIQRISSYSSSEVTRLLARCDMDVSMGGGLDEFTRDVLLGRNECLAS